MEIEQSYFLKILNNYIHKDKTTLCNDANWKALLHYAQTQQVVPILYAQCKEFIPQNAIDSIRSCALANISLYVKRKQLVENLLSNFDQEGIKYTLIKGETIAVFYPNCQFRTMGDTDILVQNKSKADLTLRKLGYSCLRKEEIGCWKYVKSGYMFEVHDRLVYSDSMVENTRCASFFNSYYQYLKDDHTLDDSFHFVFVLYHLYEHLFYDRGAGFRQFLDIAILMYYNKFLDWKWIENKLTDLKMLDFARKVFYLIEKWFGVVSKIQVSTISESEYLGITEQIFNEGVFGAIGQEDAYSRKIKNMMDNQDTSFFKAKLKFILATLFPSYNVMLKEKQYRYLITYKYFLPVAWIHRAVEKLFNKENRKHLIKKISVSSREASDSCSYFEVLKN